MANTVITAAVGGQAGVGGRIAGVPGPAPHHLGSVAGVTVDEAPRQREQRLAVDEAFTAFAVLELPGRSTGAQAGQPGQIEHPPQSAVEAFRSEKVAADAARILWNRNKSGVGRQPPGCAERR